MTGIYGFTGKYRWLSNFPDCEVVVDGVIYPSVECGYQASKTNDMTERAKFIGIRSSEAKKLGPKVTLRPDWEHIKIDIMRNLLVQKFSREPFRNKLLATGSAYIEETNWWGDTFWGVCNKKGENVLGKLIMEIREDLRKFIDS